MVIFVRKAAAGITAMLASCLLWGGQRDTLFLTVDELFRRGMETSLVLQADTLDCRIAEQGLRSARMAQAPDVVVGLTGGYLGQPVVFLHGLDDATLPENPDWSQNYSVDVTQPVYQGGRIRRTIRRAENSIILASQRLDILLGLDEQLLIVPDTAALRPAMLAETYETCLMRAYDSDPSVRLARRRVALAENEVRIASADYLPTISLYAGNTLAY